MKETEVVFSNTFIADRYSVKILQPGVQAFNFPTAPISPQRAPILSGRLDAIAAVRSNRLDPLGSELGIQRVAVVGSVANQALRLCQDKSRCESCCHKGDFIWRSTLNVNGDRKPWLSASAMTFVPLPRLVFPTARPPFLRRQRSRR